MMAAQGRRSPVPVVVAAATALAMTFAPLAAQDVEVPAFNTLTNPPGPAWTLLGIEPSAVERPSTPTALGLSLLRTVEDAGGFPDQWAVELSPWWMLSRPDLEWSDDLERTVRESILRTLGVSVATARTETGDRPVTSLAVAVRLSFVSGRVPERTRTRARQLQAMLTAVAVDASERAQAIRERLGTDSIFRVKAAEDLEAAQEWLRAHEDSIEVLVRQSADHAELRRAAAELQLNAATREGFFLELNAGWAVDAPRNVVDSASTRQLGIWLSPSWIGDRASVVGVLRYLSDPINR
ncbi:MAG TPA: hypothetical protein VE173_00005, partial [Longimicrobiales bacterium]|nr:hypothetical protein [Longimicrobiales bacterium]